MPKKTFLVLWGLVLARLLVPFSVPSGWSIYTLLHRYTTAAAVQPAAGAAPAVPAWGILWAAGTLLCAVLFAAAYWKCYQEFQMSFPVENAFARQWLQEHPLRRTVSIRQSDRIASPLTFGILHPAILMPRKTDWADETTLQYVLAHECVHIRRLDTAAKLLLIAADKENAASTVPQKELRAMEDRAMGTNTATTGEEETLMSYVDPKDGKTYYSFDNGKTFTPMTDAEFEQAYPTPNIEWWTYDEYKAWLENEKKTLQEMVGEQGYTNTQGWFTWTQEMVDETIADYESILEDIKNGIMYSKSVDGEEDVMVSYNRMDVVLGTSDALHSEA